MKTVNERIAEMRALMKEKNIDIYYIPNEDDHLSEEYTATYFQCKSYISGFSGEAGCVIITQDFAGLWTDGRYFTQAENELKGTCVELMRLRQPGVLDPLDFLVQNVKEGGVVGFDGRVVSAENVKNISSQLKKKNVTIHMDEDLAGLVWSQRPIMPTDPIYILEKKYTGQTAKERIDIVREEMKKKNTDVLVLTKLEDPCWLLNVRGNDIECTPVAYAFALVTSTKVNYYIDEKKVDEKIKKYFKENGVSLRPYLALADDLKKLKNKTVWADLNSLNAKLYTSLDTSNIVLNAPSPIVLMRAIKNSVEIKNTKKAHIKDGVAVVKFIYWLKQNKGSKDLTELSAQNELYRLREEQKDYIEPSFGTISAYGPNGAMMHYAATEKKFSKCKGKGFLLVDSGGTYKDGTTDITRTIALGELTEEEKMLYTLVLKGHVALNQAKFLYGTTGNNLDILARGPMWNVNIDYQCGTGHGVGHVLGVHEGPHGIRWGMPVKGRNSAPLEAGMIVTNEPGVYLPHKLGIRIENELLVVKDKKNFYGQFLKFEQLTWVPYEREAIDSKYLSDQEIVWINQYHAQVYENISPYLNREEKKWLKTVTSPIKK